MDCLMLPNEKSRAAMSNPKRAAMAWETVERKLTIRSGEMVKREERSCPSLEARKTITKTTTMAISWRLEDVTSLRSKCLT